MVELSKIKVFFPPYNIYDFFICFATGIYVLFFSYLTLFACSLFQLGKDVAIFNQAFWTTINEGGILENSFEGVSHFGFHFSPILFSLFPFYILAPGPEILLISQSVLLGLGAIPVYLCGRELTGNRAGLVAGLIYLVYPAVHGINLFAFHELAFLPFFLGMGLWGYLTDRKNVCLAFCLASLLIKEDVALIIGMLGIMGIIKSRTFSPLINWRYYLFIILSVILLILYLLFMKPAYGLDDASYSSLFTSQYSDPLVNLTTNNDDRLAFLVQMFLPLLFSPLLSLEILVIAVPSFIEILFSSPDIFIYYNIASHYPALVIPVIFMAMVVSLQKILCNRNASIRRGFYPLLILILVSSVASSLLYSPVTSLVPVLFADYSPDFKEDITTLQTIAHIIPREASVSTQWQLLTLMSERRFVWEDYHEGADIILIFPFYNGANVFSDNKDEIIEKYDPVTGRNDIYLFVRKDNPVLKEEIRTKMMNAGIMG
jgi:uncharacterized membrane protein